MGGSDDEPVANNGDGVKKRKWRERLTRYQLEDLACSGLSRIPSVIILRYERAEYGRRVATSFSCSFVSSWWQRKQRNCRDAKMQEKDEGQRGRPVGEAPNRQRGRDSMRGFSYGVGHTTGC